MNHSDYIAQETVTGVVPMLKKDRQYSFLDLFLSTSGFAIATWCYAQGAYVAQYLGFKQMLINIFCFINGKIHFSSAYKVFTVVLKDKSHNPLIRCT